MTMNVLASPVLKLYSPSVLARRCLASAGLALLPIAIAAQPFAKGDKAHNERPRNLDLSGAKEMEVTIRWPQPDPASEPIYLPNLCGVEGNNYVKFTQGGQTKHWKTTPKLDTTTSGDVNWIKAGGLLPFDYDGVPPLEFINTTNIVFQCSGDGATLSQVGQFNCFPNATVESRYLVDVNGDGYDDAVYHTWLSDDPDWVRAVLGGPGYGMEPCARSVVIPNPYADYFPGQSENKIMQPVRCGDGKLRTVLVGQQSDMTRGIYLIEIDGQKADTGYVWSFRNSDTVAYDVTHLDPGEFWVARPMSVVKDDIRNRQYVIVLWEDGWHRMGACHVVYEITNGKLEELAVYTDNFSAFPHSYGNSFDDGDPVIHYGVPGMNKIFFARVTSIDRPFACYQVAGLGGGRTFIDDQYGDGSRDLLITSQSTVQPASIALVNFDLRPTSVNDPESDGTAAWAAMQGNSLVLTMPEPSAIEIAIVDASGRAVWQRQHHAPAGRSALQLDEAVATLATGAYYIRVSAGQASTTLPYLR